VFPPPGTYHHVRHGTRVEVLGVAGEHVEIRVLDGTLKGEPGKLHRLWFIPDGQEFSAANPRAVWKREVA
jgi:hypothetical protein